MATTGLQIVSKIARNPGRALRRAVLHLRLARLEREHERRRLLEALASTCGADGPRLLAEFRDSEFRAWFEAQRRVLARYPAPYRHGTSHPLDCELLYLIVRALEPEHVVETGVLYGASSAHVLAALAQNGRGRLYSIDIGNPPHEPPPTFFVPPELQARWQLVRGDIRRVLPPLLARLGRVDLFHHDSLHTPEHMLWEYEMAYAHLAPGGAITTHDLLTVLTLRHPFRRHPFRAFCERHRLRRVESWNLGLAWSGPAPLAMEPAAARSF